MTRTLAVLAALVVLRPAAAVADSDGYYCAGPGYLAYEMRFSQGSGHRLYVVRFSRAEGIRPPMEVPLDDFQVQRMTCGADEVALVGGGRRYVVTLSASGVPRVTAASAERVPPGPLANLGHWAAPEIVDLPSDGRPGEFQLAIARISRQTPVGVEHLTFTSLIRRAESPEAPLLESVRLFEGVFLETVD